MNRPTSQPAPGAQHDHESAPEHPPINGRGASIALVLVAILVIGLAAYGIWKRHHTDEVLAETTQRDAAPSVIALPARPGAPTDTFELPGNVTAWSDAPIYARTTGYLTKWYFDIGAHVKKGDLLAEIATPELDQQVAQAEADLATAETNAGNAKTQAERYKGLVTSDAVSRQDTETFVTQAASTSSAVKSAQANVDRLKQLQSFEKIYAPFDGVVTARNIDNGQLINVGASELFHLQALGTLRVYVNVPEVYTSSVHRGEKINLTFPQFPDRNFEGTLVRTADVIDPLNRTLLVEIDVNNRKGELMPGSLAQVHFKARAVGQTFVVPASAIVFRTQGIRVATVANGNVAHLVPVTIGNDNGATVEIIAGLNASDRVIQDPPDSIIEGEKLNVESSNQQPAPNGGKQ
ncbi:efflux RND transporter periplasmic adaptor subunit [Acidobacteria bacterium AB60]|nr:efflux RND transporter periplasmic adaptor subunit [Acidobacteria bacterium AB60]